MTLLLTGLQVGPTWAATVMLNNGQAPPTAENVIANAGPAGDQLYIRNLDCPPSWPAGSPGAPCVSPGNPTRVDLVDAGQAGFLRPYDTSKLKVSGGSAIGIVGNGDASSEITGGQIGSYSSNGRAHLTFAGGTIADSLLCNGDSTALVRKDAVLDGPLRALGDSRVTVLGGSHTGPFEAYNDATIDVFGDGFQLDAVPQPFGLIGATSGQLTGTLASGHGLNVAIAHDGEDVLLTGRIVLHPAPVFVPGLGPAGVGACAALMTLGALRTRLRKAG